MTTETFRLNDVNIEAVGALVGAIDEEPTNAETLWKAEVLKISGTRSGVHGSIQARKVFSAFCSMKIAFQSL